MSILKCEWCGQELGNPTEWWEQAKSGQALHQECYAKMWNLARRMQELKDLINEPEIIEVSNH